jgi:hypothetical protein
VNELVDNKNDKNDKNDKNKNDTNDNNDDNDKNKKQIAEKDGITRGTSGAKRVGGGNSFKTMTRKQSRQEL